MASAAGVVVALMAAGPAALRADEKPSFVDSLKKGKTTINLRYRFEEVSDDLEQKDAHASTLRTALGYRTQAYKGFSLKIEVENVAVIGNDLYDNLGSGSLANQNRDRPVVADPALTEINQALLRYQGNRWQVAFGRQEIALGDARHIGNVGWRQNHQSFDALRIDNSSLGGLRFTYAFVDRVHQITGQSLDLEGHLINASFDLQNAGRFTLYSYLLDFDRFNSASTATWGLEFAGKRRLSGTRTLLYEAEHAVQSDHGDNPRNYESDYSTLMLGVGLPKVTIKLAWESLGGNLRGGPFRTPLATLHKFNGWADKFLGTPTLGLDDLNLQLDGKIGEVAWLVRYHEFQSELRSVDYGQELDLQLLYTCPKGMLLGLKGALFDAERGPSDTDKWMVWAVYGF